METKNVAYFGEDVVINHYLRSAKNLFESTIELVEKGGVVFKEKKVLMILMDSVMTKVEHRLFQEMVRTRTTGELHTLPEEFLLKDNATDSIWENVDFDEFKDKLINQLNVLKQNRDEDYNNLKDLVEKYHS